MSEIRVRGEGRHHDGAAAMTGGARKARFDFRISIDRKSAKNGVQLAPLIDHPATSARPRRLPSPGRPLGQPRR